MERFGFQFNYAYLYSVVHISIQWLTFSFSKVYDNIYDMYGPQNFPQLYKDYFTRQKPIKTCGKEEWQMTGITLRLRVGLQLCDWIKQREGNQVQNLPNSMLSNIGTVSL